MTSLLNRISQKFADWTLVSVSGKIASMDGTFWLSPKGQRFGREPMEEDHEDIGRRILIQMRVNYDHRAKDGLYVVLFGLNYLRGVEYTEVRSIYVENDGLHDMTQAAGISG